jgi:hypothetical protein
MDNSAPKKEVRKIMLSAFERDETSKKSGIDKIRDIFNRKDIIPGLEFEHNGQTYKVMDLWDE